MLVRRARGILDDLARTEDDIRNLDADPTGLVRVGLPGTISAMVSLPLDPGGSGALSEDHAQHNRGDERVHRGMAVVKGKIDLAVLYSRSSNDPRLLLRSAAGRRTGGGVAGGGVRHRRRSI